MLTASTGVRSAALLLIAGLPICGANGDRAARKVYVALAQGQVDPHGALEASRLRVCQLAHLAHGMATQPARGRVGRGVPVGAVSDVHGDMPAQPVDQAPTQRDE